LCLVAGCNKPTHPQFLLVARPIGCTFVVLAASMAAWHCDVFQGTAPDDHVPGLHVVPTTNWAPPELFQNVWSEMSKLLLDLPGWLERASPQVILMLCDVSDEAHRSMALQLVSALVDQALWLPLFIYPVASQASSIRDVMGEFVQRGAHHVIMGMPRGHALALAISTAYAKVCLRLDSVSSEARSRAAAAQLVSSYRQTVTTALWHFVPRHFGLVIPQVDANLDRHDGRIAGYQMHNIVGEGRHARVFKVTPPPGVVGCPKGEVIKAVEKTAVRTLEHLRAIDRSCRVMEILRTRWYHPQIARLLQVYNSPTHLYLRMEQAGDEDLYERLRARDLGQRPLSSQNISAIVTQLACVIDHLHSGPRICHRDLKPENVMVSNEHAQGGIIAKLIDFDFAAVQPRGKRCRVPCGTLPFMAPEVLESSYDGTKADIWSLGVLFLDLGCHLRCVEKSVLGMVEENESMYEHRPAWEAAQQLTEAFSSTTTVRDIIRREGAPELAMLEPWYTPCTTSMLQVHAQHRPTSDSLLVWLERFAIPSFGMVVVHTMQL